MIVPTVLTADVSQVLTIELRNAADRACTNVVVGLTLPPELRLEKGKTDFSVPRLDSSAVHPHALHVRAVRGGPMIIAVANLSYRNGFGETRRIRDRTLQVVAHDPVETPAVAPTSRSAPAPRHPSERQSIFVSYRRSDTDIVPGLIRELGRRKALHGVDFFCDVDDIRTGMRWRSVLAGALQKCTLFVAVIGPRWLAQDEDGRRRIDDADDPVRFEIATALRREIPLTPLLVGSSMPDKFDLPPEISDLLDHHAFRFEVAQYDDGVRRLARDLRAQLPRRPRSA